jgi:uncharacterized damage-inducible protein DinB
MSKSEPEVWLRGPVDGVQPLLQPIAHALLQAREEVAALVDGFPDDLLWTRPGGVASAGFHLQHLSGVIDRLFTYARGEALSESQRQALLAEGRADEGLGAVGLSEVFSRQVDRAIAQLRATDERTLTDARAVGRKQLPSTVQGLLFHAAEHTQRHVGQLLVTVRVQLNARGSDAQRTGSDPAQ